MGITAKELAEKLNLSAAAVSMALHNKPGVSTQTRQLVYDTALKYGFDFSRISEKKQVDGSIYLIIYQKHGTVVADTPFFLQSDRRGISRLQKSGLQDEDQLCLRGGRYAFQTNRGYPLFRLCRYHPAGHGDDSG